MIFVIKVKKLRYLSNHEFILDDGLLTRDWQFEARHYDDASTECNDGSPKPTAGCL